MPCFTMRRVKLLAIAVGILSLITGTRIIGISQSSAPTRLVVKLLPKQALKVEPTRHGNRHSIHMEVEALQRAYRAERRAMEMESRLRTAEQTATNYARAVGKFVRTNGGPKALDEHGGSKAEKYGGTKVEQRCCWNRAIQPCIMDGECDDGGEGCIASGTLTAKYGVAECARRCCWNRFTQPCVMDGECDDGGEGCIMSGTLTEKHGVAECGRVDENRVAMARLVSEDVPGNRRVNI